MAARISQKQRLFLRGVRFDFQTSPQIIIPLSREDSHYLLTVLRLPYGTEIEVASSDTGELASGVIHDDHGKPSVRLTGLIPHKEQGKKDITLLVALCKGPKNDLLVDWTTELGCTKIIFWQSERSIVRLKNSTEAEQKRVRYQKIAQSAAQQSKQRLIPQVAVLLSLEMALKELPLASDSTRLICSLRTSSSPIKEVLENSETSKSSVLAVGPEGDFTPDEYEALTKAEAFVPVSLGDSTLRSELAVLTALIAMRF